MFQFYLITLLRKKKPMWCERKGVYNAGKNVYSGVSRPTVSVDPPQKIRMYICRIYRTMKNNKIDYFLSEFPRNREAPPKSSNTYIF